MYKTSIQSIRDALDAVGRHEQQLILDSLACMFHNEGYFLQGNTQDYDVQWLAAQMWNQAQPYYCNMFDRQPADVQQMYLRYADVALKALPALCERIADRYIAASKALRSMIDDLKIVKVPSNQNSI